jgi:glutamate-ammonia-ligase adenylyltransferase
MAATPHFAEKISAEILHALYRETPPATIRADTLAMRDRLAADLPPAGPFDVKHLPGGLLELSFIAEALQLIHGPANPALFRVNTSEALRTLANAGHLVPHDAQALIAADFFWRTIQGINRITGLADKESTPQPVMLAPLLRATGLPDLDALKAGMAQTAQTVRDCFERYITTGVRE